RLYGTGGQDGGLRQVDHGIEPADAEHAEVGDREGPALVFFRPQTVRAGAAGKIAQLRGDLRCRLRIRGADDGSDKTVLERHGHGDVGVAEAPDDAAVELDIAVRYLHERAGAGLDEKVGDGNAG